MRSHSSGNNPSLSALPEFSSLQFQSEEQNLRLSSNVRNKSGASPNFQVNSQRKRVITDFSSLNQSRSGSLGNGSLENNLGNYTQAEEGEVIKELVEAEDEVNSPIHHLKQES